MDLKQMHADRASFIAAIRAFSESQCETWQLVPWLALQADGRDGGMGGYHEFAYHWGFWELHIPNWQWARLYVRCDTGKIYAYYDLLRPSHDDLTLKLGNYLELLDAGSVCSKLISQAQRPRPSWISREEWVQREEKRKGIAAKLGLTERYIRRQSIAA